MISRPNLSSQSGFTLLEVIIAITIMVLAFASILSLESNSISATTRSKEMNIVTMLARGKMIESEYAVEGKTFEEVKKADGGTFETPFEKFRWTMEVKEIKFPKMNMGGGSKSSGGGSANGDDQSQYAELITKLLTNYFNKAIREMVVTIFWKRSSTEVSYSVSTYWVDLNHEFETTEE